MRNDFSTLFSGMLSSAFSGGTQGELTNRELQTGKENYIYHLYLPPQAAETSAKLPLIVFLHGIRERGRDGFIKGMFATIIKQYLKQLPALVLFPQCRPNRYWTDAEMTEMIAGQLESVGASYAVEAERQYLIGVSMGGYGVWHLAANFPEKFAALVSICGGSPLTTGDRFTPIAKKIGATPVWLFHGADDQIVQVSESRSMVAALKTAGGNVKYSEYADVGHNVWLNALGEKDLLPWLLAQRLTEK